MIHSRDSNRTNLHMTQRRSLLYMEQYNRNIVDHNWECLFCVCVYIYIHVYLYMYIYEKPLITAFFGPNGPTSVNTWYPNTLKRNCYSISSLHLILLCITWRWSTSAETCRTHLMFIGPCIILIAE